MNFFYPDKETVTISINETTSVRDLNYIISVFAEAAKKEPIAISDIIKANNISENLVKEHLTF